MLALQGCLKHREKVNPKALCNLETPVSSPALPLFRRVYFESLRFPRLLRPRSLSGNARPRMRCPTCCSEPSTWREVIREGKVSPGQDLGPRSSSLQSVWLSSATLPPRTLHVLLCEMGRTTSALPNLPIPPDLTQAQTRKRRPQHCVNRPKCHKRHNVCWRRFPK